MQTPLLRLIDMETYFKECQNVGKRATLDDYFKSHVAAVEDWVNEDIFKMAATDLKQHWTQKFATTKRKYPDVPVGHWKHWKALNALNSISSHIRHMPSMM